MTEPRYANIEIIEWVDRPVRNDCVVPNDLRIDGVSYHAPFGAEIETRASGDSVTEVTLTLLAGSVKYIRKERDPEPPPTYQERARAALAAAIRALATKTMRARARWRQRGSGYIKITTDQMAANAILLTKITKGRNG